MSGHRRLIIATQGFRGGDGDGGDTTINQVDPFPTVIVDSPFASGTVLLQTFSATVRQEILTGGVTIESIPANLIDTETQGKI